MQGHANSEGEIKARKYNDLANMKLWQIATPVAICHSAYLVVFALWLSYDGALTRGSRRGER
jgi:hypothetical protein